MSLFKPKWTINSVYDIKAEDLASRAYKGVVVDLDNTLLPWYEEVYSEEMAAWIQSLKDLGIDVFLVSNNTRPRVSRVAAPLDVKYTANALKPLSRSFRIALREMDLAKDQVVVIGDQIMTDVLGANLVGLDTILVKPLASTDIVYSVINRQLEKIVMRRVGIDREGDWGNDLE